MFEHSPIVVDDFRGRFDRGFEEAVPRGYFLDEGNLIFARGEFESRRGFAGAVPGLESAEITRIYEYRRTGEVSRFIYCNSSGQFYDSLNPSTPILTLVGVSDFAMVVMFNRAYISPHNRVTGSSNQKVYVYDGSGTARLAAGVAPTGTGLTATTGGPTESDAIEKGIHLFAIAFETSSGFITKPALNTNQIVVYDAPGGKDVNLTNIYTGPTGTAARHILVTKVIPGYQAETQQYQNWFFLPNGRIPNNIYTALQFSFFDVSLTDSADRLLDQLEEIPAGVFLVDYEGQMCVGGEAENSSTVRVSVSAQPEAFSAVDGFVNVSPGDAGGGVKNGVAHRGMLYIAKSQRFYATQTNGGSPSSWAVVSVDSGIGTECFGISSVLDSRGHSRDQFLVAARSGVYQYLGAFSERELTWNIQSLWRRITQAHFNKVHLVVDPQRQCLYVPVPLDGATEISHIFYGDYSEALDPSGIKWSLWWFPKKPSSTLVKVDDTTQRTYPVFGSIDGGIYKYDETSYNDFGAKIESFYETHMFEPEGSAGQINHYAGFRQRIRGSGTMTVSIRGYDNAITENMPAFSLAIAPGGEVLTRLDFQAERAYLRCTLAAINQWFLVNRYSCFMKPLWTERPE